MSAEIVCRYCVISSENHKVMLGPVGKMYFSKSAAWLCYQHNVCAVMLNVCMSACLFHQLFTVLVLH